MTYRYGFFSKEKFSSAIFWKPEGSMLTNRNKLNPNGVQFYKFGSPFEYSNLIDQFIKHKEVESIYKWIRKMLTAPHFSTFPIVPI